jgi:hypothetical protein
VTSRLLAVAGAALVLAGCGGEEQRAAERQPETVRVDAQAQPPLRIREVRGSVVRMGSLGGERLLGVRLRADVCSRSGTEADRTYPTSFRIAHYALRSRAAKWGKPFRTLANDLYWIVPLGETRRVCGDVEFEDVIPPDNYGGLESALGYLRGCYAVHLMFNAILESPNRGTFTPISAGKRVILQCGRFGPR